MGRKKKDKQKYKLVIVESPTKAKTISKFLKKGYKVISCMGHLIDLPKSRMGVDLQNTFEPEYVTVRGKGKLLQEIKRYGKDSQAVYLASDEDREGEAIAYHLQKVLQERYKDLQVKRIIFHEITRDVIKQAIKNPQEVDYHKVDAQKARRVLDRIVGYSISPVLWEKVKKGLSAGRVQSVALNMICEREEEILNFKPQEYWSLDLEIKKQKQKKTFQASFATFKNERIKLTDKKTVDEILGHIKGNKAIINNIINSSRTRKPFPPFTTSKLQQTAAGRLNFSSAKTMIIAQRLYEGVNTGQDVTGLITYMRTDSVRVSQSALNDVRNFIAANFPDYKTDQPNFYKTSKKAQDAHEAIRPTSVYNTPEKMKNYLNKDEYKLYAIIWERFVASQMKPMRFKNVKINIAVGEAVFNLTGSVLEDKGFSAAYKVLKAESKSVKLPHFYEKEELDIVNFLPEQHFTSPPPRFSDASIVKIMEESGIGRPSTYAPTIERLIRKYYIKRVKRQLVPTVLGNIINRIMEKHFNKIINTNFTAEMENNLDQVADGEKNWNQVLNEFYPGFQQTMQQARENIKDMKNILDEPTNLTCPDCGKPLIKKLGKYGYFIACSGFPDCHHTESISLGDCPNPECKSGKIIARKTKKGRDFYGCTKYPACDFVCWDAPTDKKCPQCGNILFETGNKKRGYFYECMNKNCKYKKKQEESA
ncbi:MAG TPA: type I DNA topoisomerase [Spirochaetota bacterium]|nr:type I DNA topoisomerase [Spirochaetota bacterium]